MAEAYRGKGRRPRQAVVTVHGVNSDRVWQQRIEEALWPHFECHGYEYHDYGTLIGTINVLADIRYLLGAVILLVFSLGSNLASSSLFEQIYLLLALLFLVASIVAANRRRGNCVSDLKLDIDKNRYLNHPPHVIAHSLGTFLIGKALQKYPDLRFGRVILVSTILPEQFPWRDLLSRRPNSLQSVRSEFGVSDLITRFTSFLGGFYDDFGGAGVYGFDTDPTWVHTSPNPTSPCPYCGQSKAPVHNVPIIEFAHSDQLVSWRHAFELWLPTLWGYEIEETVNFWERCRQISEFEHQNLYADANALSDELWSKAYSWTQNLSLQAYVSVLSTERIRRGRKSIQHRLKDILEEIKYLIPNIIDVAIRECQSLSSANETVCRALNPAIAITSVIEKVVSEYE